MDSESNGHGDSHGLAITRRKTMQTLKEKIVGFLLKKYILGYLVKGWTAAKGYKTQIFMGLSVLTWIGEVTGNIPHDVATQLYAGFGGGAGFSFMQKLQRYQPQVEGLINEVKKGETR